MRIHSGMSLFSGRQPLDTDALWRGEHAILPVQSFPPAPGASGGSIPDLKAFTGVDLVRIWLSHMLRKRGRACLPSLFLSQRTTNNSETPPAASSLSPT